MRFATLGLVALVLSAAVSRDLFAVPIQFGTGNYYEHVDAAVDWATAKSNAAAMTYNGMQGHLAVITSEAENLFVAQNLGVFLRAWIAGSDAAVEGDFRWDAGPEAGTLFWTGGLTGSAVGYANFPVGSEPNNLDGDESNVEIFYFSAEWNDQFHGDKISYIVEYELVPEPATALLGLTGLAGACLLRRRAMGCN